MSVRRMRWRGRSRRVGARQYSLSWAVRGYRALRMQRAGVCVEVLLTPELRVFRRRARVAHVADCHPFLSPRVARAS